MSHRPSVIPDWINGSLPSSWKLARFDEVAHVVTGQTPPTKHKEYYHGPIPFVTPVDLVTESAIAFYLVRGNGNRNLVGRSGQAPESDTPIAFPDLLIEVVPNESLALAEFLRFAWDCPEVRRDIEERARTAAGIYKINLRNLSEVLLPLPEVTVQHQTANRLEQRFREAANLERSCHDQLAAIESTPTALLRTAFQGQL